MVFASEPMRRLAVLVARVAPRDVTVLITGESGTGKERVAEAIVAASPRGRTGPSSASTAPRSRPSWPRPSCSATPGAPSPARSRARPGLFGEADGGTILLDEVGELAPGAQAKLLRVLQEGEVRPGRRGAGRARWTCACSPPRTATSRRRCGAGRFREDLFYRLNVVHLARPAAARAARGRPGAGAPLPRAASRSASGSRRCARREALLRPARRPRLARQRARAGERDGEPGRALARRRGSTCRCCRPGGGDGGGARRRCSLKQRVEAYERGLVVEALRGDARQPHRGRAPARHLARHPARQAQEVRAGRGRATPRRSRTRVAGGPAPRPGSCRRRSAASSFVEMAPLALVLHLALATADLATPDLVVLRDPGRSREASSRRPRSGSSRAMRSSSAPGT